MIELNDAIENLYRAFATIPKPTHIDGCPCCIDRKDIGVLLGQDLRSIAPEELASYASSAFLTVGDVADYLYFLPRILEISAIEPSWWPDPEVTAGAIRTANPDAWTANQQTALNEYLESVIGNAIRSGEYHLLDSWICAIARIGREVRSHLGRIAECPAAVLVYFEANAEDLPRNRLSNPFWELPCPEHDAIVDWFFSPQITRVPFEVYGCALTRSQ